MEAVLEDAALKDLIPLLDAIGPLKQDRVPDHAIAWRNAGGQGLASYQAGTPGPAEAERLILQNGRAWRSLTEGC
jgi:hypothetical protein